MIQKPIFADPTGIIGGPSVAAIPPFNFTNVTARVFPLNANMASLTKFCNLYLNMDVPPEIVHYTPALPYVYFMILNYGAMSFASVQAQNLGWVAQHEIAFAVPVSRWHMEDGKLIFDDWAVVCPFIFVDDQFSLNSGREVFGWNKVTCEIDAGIPGWVDDPLAPLRYFGMSLVDFSDAYSGQASKLQPFLSVSMDPLPSFLRLPPDPADPWSPWQSVSSAINSAGSLIGEVLDFAVGSRLRGYEAHRSVGSLLAMAARAGSTVKPLLPRLLPEGREGRAAYTRAVDGLPSLFLDVVTLKQFRNPENPTLACYQALVGSKMGVDRVNRCGLLGDMNLLRGDSSGGYTIRLHDYNTQPIIQTLGLEVRSNEWADDGVPIANLKPVLPFWLDVDLYYGKGNVICSRAHGNASAVPGQWLDEIKNEYYPPNIPDPLPLYNTLLGAATQPIMGPFNFPDVTYQVYPLLADPVKMAAYVEYYLNDPLKPTAISGGGRSGDGLALKSWGPTSTWWPPYTVATTVRCGHLPTTSANSLIARFRFAYR